MSKQDNNFAHNAFLVIGKHALLSNLSLSKFDPCFELWRRYIISLTYYPSMSISRILWFPPFEAFGLTSQGVTLTYQSGEKLKNIKFIKQNFKKIFCEIFQIPYEEKPAEQFLTDLYRLLLYCPISQKDLLNDLQAKNPYAYGIVYRYNPILDDGHLITQVQNIGWYPMLLVYTSPLPISKIKSLFSTIIYTLERLQHLQAQINSRPAPSSYHSLMNIHINTFYYTLCYSIKSKKLLLEECKEMTHTPHSVKFLSLGPLHCSILQQNTDFLEVLYRITGGNVKALDDFAQLLAKIVAPVPKYPSLAVVFTKKNVKAVRRFFLQLFRQKCKEAGSAIRILQQGREAEILAHQVRGGMLVLLNDQLPSDTKVGKFLSLIHGKKYPLKNKYIPNQSFHNRQVFVCITDQPKIVKSLTQQYRATLVDLSIQEMPCSSSFHLTPQELTWLQRNLILHGIRQQYPSIRLKHSKAKRKEKKAPLPVRDLPRFLEYCCSYDPNARPTRDEVYAAYQNFCLSSTVETPIRFGKQLRALLSESLPNVEYKVARRQDLDGTALCYVGLNVKQDTAPSESPPPETVPSVPDTFRNLLVELEHFSDEIIPTFPSDTFIV